jgi:hypothetical protein
MAEPVVDTINNEDELVKLCSPLIDQAFNKRQIIVINPSAGNEVGQNENKLAVGVAVGRRIKEDMEAKIGLKGMGQLKPNQVGAETKEEFRVMYRLAIAKQIADGFNHASRAYGVKTQEELEIYIQETIAHEEAHFDAFKNFDPNGKFGFCVEFAEDTSDGTYLVRPLVRYTNRVEGKALLLVDAMIAPNNPGKSDMSLVRGVREGLEGTDTYEQHIAPKLVDKKIEINDPRE